jgi:hypothetical protein
MCRSYFPLSSFNAKRKECRSCSVIVKLFDRYGINLEQYTEMLEQQDGHCAICPATPEEVGTLCVDHDHTCCPGPKTCGQCLRGLLCSRCNAAIGLLDDDIDRMHTAAAYVDSYRSYNYIGKDLTDIDEL